MHGYAIIRHVKEVSKGRIVLSTGTLYGAIKRLLDQDWIERVDEPQGHEDVNIENKRIRKSYSLTRKGKKCLHNEIDRIQQLLNAASYQLQGTI